MSLFDTKRAIQVSVLVGILSPSFAVANIDAGLQWLSTTANANGSFATESDASAFIQIEPCNNAENLSRKIPSALSLGEPTVLDVDELLGLPLDGGHLGVVCSRNKSR